MKKNIFTALLLMLVLTGCVGSTQKHAQDITLDEIYNEWKEITDVRYDITMLVVEAKEVDPNEVLSISFYMKDQSKTRVESKAQGKESVFILNKADGVNVLYVPSENYYVDMSFSEDSLSEPGISESMNNFYEKLKEEYTIIDVEKINGREALALQKTTDATDIPGRIWIDAELLLPVKIQNLDDSGVVLMDAELHNLSTDVLDESLFQIPTGAQERTIFEALEFLLGDATNGSAAPQ